MAETAIMHPVQAELVVLVVVQALQVIPVVQVRGSHELTAVAPVAGARQAMVPVHLAVEVVRVTPVQVEKPAVAPVPAAVQSVFAATDPATAVGH